MIASVPPLESSSAALFSSSTEDILNFPEVPTGPVVLNNRAIIAPVVPALVNDDSALMVEIKDRFAELMNTTAASDPQLSTMTLEDMNVLERPPPPMPVPPLHTTQTQPVISSAVSAAPVSSSDYSMLYQLPQVQLGMKFVFVSLCEGIYDTNDNNSYRCIIAMK